MLPSQQNEIGLAVAQAVVAAVSVAVSALSLAGAAQNWLIAIPIFLFGILWVLLTALQLAFTQNPWLLLPVFIVPVIFGFLFGGFSVGVLGGLLLMFTGLGFARIRLRHDLNDRLKFHVGTVFKPGVKLLIISWLLFLAGLALPLLTGVISSSGVRVTEDQVNYVIKPFEPVLENYLPVGPLVNFDDIIDAEISKQDLDPAATSFLREQIESDFSERGLETNSSLAGTAASQINNALAIITEGNALTVALLIIVLALVAVRAFIPAIALLLIWLQTGLVKVLLKTDILRLETKQVQAEKISL